MTLPDNELEYRQHVERAVRIGLEEAEPGEDIVEIAPMIYDYNIIIQNTPRCLSVLRYSRNQPEEWTHLVHDGMHYRDVIQAMALDVFRQDVYEELNRQTEDGVVD